MGIIYSETNSEKNSVENNNSWDVVNTNQNGEVESVEAPFVEETADAGTGEELVVEPVGEDLDVEELVVEPVCEELVEEEESLVELTNNNLLKKNIQDGIEESLLAMNKCVEYLKNGGINELTELEEYDDEEYDDEEYDIPTLISVASEPSDSDSYSEKSEYDSSDSEMEEKPNKRYSKLVKTYYNYKIEVPINIKLCLFMGVLLLAYKSLYCYCE